MLRGGELVDESVHSANYYGMRLFGTMHAQCQFQLDVAGSARSGNETDNQISIVSGDNLPDQCGSFVVIIDYIFSIENAI